MTILDQIHPFEFAAAHWWLSLFYQWTQSSGDNLIRPSSPFRTVYY
uniref:Glycosyl transferase n=1 Tax=Heterorhabditis bacteriophora TaxID=37862 RepID=A0A1I7WHY6_HETBA